MKSYFTKALTSFIMIALSLTTACSSEPVEVPQGGEKELVSSTNTPPAEELLREEPSPVEQAVVELSDQPYASPSNSFQITLPEGWNCSETGEFQVNCHSPDQSAELQAMITATGYELVQEAFLSFTHAELVHAYSEIKEYVEIERLEREGHLTVAASWREGDVHWQGDDYFIRTGGTIFHLQTRVKQTANDMYGNLFTEVAESVDVFPSEIIGAQLYINRKTHIAQEIFFEVNVPTAWSKYVDAATVEKTIIEGFLSPDMRASVQIAVFRHGVLIKQSLKAEKTLEIMRILYGYDLRVSHDKALPDGRERLEWYASNKNINGISYFDSYANSLYVFSIIWEESTAEIYLPLLEEIAASFSRE